MAKQGRRQDVGFVGAENGQVCAAVAVGVHAPRPEGDGVMASLSHLALGSSAAYCAYACNTTSATISGKCCMFGFLTLAALAVAGMLENKKPEREALDRADATGKNLRIRIRDYIAKHPDVHKPAWAVYLSSSSLLPSPSKAASTMAGGTRRAPSQMRPTLAAG